MDPLTYIGIGAVNGLVNGLISIWKSKLDNKYRVTELNLKAGLDREMMKQSKELDFEYRRYFEERRYEQDEKILRLNKELDFEHGVRMQLLNYSIRKAEIENNFKNQLALIDRQESRDMYPLITPIGEADLIKANSSEVPIPINYFIMETNEFGENLLEKDIHIELERFFRYNGFSMSSSNPVFGRFGAWKFKNYTKRENVNFLWKVMKGIPSVILRPVFNRNKKELEFNLFIWGNSLLPNLSEENILTLRYDISSPEKNEELVKKVIPTLCCYSGAFCDCYHLIEHGVMPQTPLAMQDRFPDFIIPQEVFNLYRIALYGITKINYLGNYTPIAYLNVAKSIISLSQTQDKKIAEQLIRESVAVWENIHTNTIKDITPPQYLETAKKRIETLSSQIIGETLYIQEFHEILKSIDFKIKKIENENIDNLNSNLPVVREYEEIKEYKYGYSFVYNKRSWGLVNPMGQLIIPLEYEKEWQILKLSPIIIKGKWGYENIYKKNVIPCIYDKADSFYDCFARVNINNKWGFIDFSGEIVIPIIFDNTQIFKDGYAKVKINDKWGLIDIHGTIVVPIQYNWSIEVPPTPI